MKINFNKFLPSKIVFAVTIIPILSIVLFFVIRGVISSYSNQEKNSSDILEQKILEETEKDTDEDGLMDWQERIYKTDINSKDTDGDGSLDGTEVKIGTDPLDPFNKVKEIEGEDDVDQYDYRKDTNLTMTDKFSRDFLIKMVELKEVNLLNNKSAQEQIVKELFNENKFSLKNKYTIEDLNIKKDISKKESKAELSKIFLKNNIKDEANVRYLYLKYAEEEDLKYLNELKDNFVIYESSPKELLGVPIPKEMATIFLEYVNNIEKYNVIIKSFINTEADPIRAMAALGRSKEIEEKIVFSINKVLLEYSN